MCTRAKSLDKWLSTKKEDLFTVRSDFFHHPHSKIMVDNR